MRKTQARARRGAMIIVVAAVMVILLVGAVFTIDVAYMQLVRSELRTATDSAAQAGSEALARTQNEATAIQRAIDVANQNTVAGQPLRIQASDVEVGGVRARNNGRFDFDLRARPLTAVRVRGGRTSADPDGSVSLFFARLFDTNSFEPELIAAASSNVRDVALVLDVSGSMAASSGGVSRINALKAAVTVFLNEIEILSPSTLVSLSTYDTTSRKIISLTDNFNSIRNAANALRPGGMTAIGQGLQTGSDSLNSDPLKREYSSKSIVLMTDGQHNTGVSPLVVAQTIAGRGHSVHTVTFGSGASVSLMQQVAQATQGGTHVHADGNADLVEAFRDIARTLSVTLIE